MKALVFGSGGYIGSRLLAALPLAQAAKGDICNRRGVQHELEAHSPDIVINCAGKTGRPNIDWCESNKFRTLRANVFGPLLLLDECHARGIQLVHLSSACIFEGDNGGKGFCESDSPNFEASYYSHTKLLADQMLKRFPVLILRLRMPFDDRPVPRNLIHRLTGYKQVIDIQNSMTHLPEFIEAAVKLIERGSTGVYHIVNPGTISPYEVMSLYRQKVDNQHCFERLDREHFDHYFSTPRSNCQIASARLEKEGIELRPIREAIELALRSFGSR